MASGEASAALRPLMQSITLISAYFGRWPGYFGAFLHSCSFNPTISFLLFTDCPAPVGAPANVRFVPFSLAEFDALASRKLGQSINVRNAFKLCDFKPAYGLIFEDYLPGARFWGHIDIDVIFGQIRSFMTEEVLDGHDLISSRREYLAGHFTLYRNIPYMCRLFERSRDYRRVFASEQNFAFDECHVLWRPLLNGIPLASLRSPIDSMTHCALRLQRSGLIRLCLRTVVEEEASPTGAPWTGRVRWTRGRLFDDESGTERMYFHFHMLKRNPLFLLPSWERPPDSYEVDASGFRVAAGAG